MTDHRDDHPIQTDPPWRQEGDLELIEAALEELDHYMWRADITPGKGNLDPNLNRCRDHLERLRDAATEQAVESDEWPCHCGGEMPDWEYHYENACGDYAGGLGFCAGPGGLGERYEPEDDSDG